MRAVVLNLDPADPGAHVLAHVLDAGRRERWTDVLTPSGAAARDDRAPMLVRSREYIEHADVVLLAGGALRRATDHDALLQRLSLDPERQVIGALGGASVALARLGLLDGRPACDDDVAGPLLKQRGIEVMPRSFVAAGRVATAAGLLSAPLLAGWVLARCFGIADAAHALRRVAPLGQRDDYVTRAVPWLRPYAASPDIAVPTPADAYGIARAG